MSKKTAVGLSYLVPNICRTGPDRFSMNRHLTRLSSGTYHIRRTS